MQESLFDRGLLRLNYHRSAREFANYSFLHDEVANRIEDNLAFFNKNFEKVLKIQRDQFIANGYEMPELLGKPFNEGMKVIITSTIPDENFDKDYEVITKVLIPQVNFNDKMIQAAQIETTKGY